MKNTFFFVSDQDLVDRNNCQCPPRIQYASALKNDDIEKLSHRCGCLSLKNIYYLVNKVKYTVNELRLLTDDDLTHTAP